MPDLRSLAGSMDDDDRKMLTKWLLSHRPHVLREALRALREDLSSAPGNSVIPWSHGYQPADRTGNPCETCGFGRHHPWHS